MPHDADPSDKDYFPQAKTSSLPLRPSSSLSGLTAKLVLSAPTGQKQMCPLSTQRQQPRLFYNEHRCSHYSDGLLKALLLLCVLLDHLHLHLF